MNIQFSNWQLINLNGFSGALSTSIAPHDALFDATDVGYLAFFNQNPSTYSNTYSEGFDPLTGYNFILQGNHFADETPLLTVTSLQFSDPITSRTFRYSSTGVTVNYDLGTITGVFNKLEFAHTSTSTSYQFLGSFGFSPDGLMKGGTATSFTYNANGNVLNLTGNLIVGADGSILSGTVTSFTFIDSLGHKLAIPSISISWADFDNLTDPATHTNLNDFYNFVTDATRLAGNDTIVADIADTQSNIINGFAGNDSINGGDGDDTLNGGLGNDTLNGGAGADSLTGDAGADSLDGGAGADIMVGGDGNDTYIVDNSSDTVIETNALAAGGIDTVRANLLHGQTYTMSENIENLILGDGTATGGTNAIDGVGNALNNRITGNSGTNYLFGSEGIDTLIGGAGDDSYYAQLKLTGTEGSDSAVLTIEDVLVESTAAIGGYDRIIIGTRNALNSFNNFNLTKASTIVLAEGIESVQIEDASPLFPSTTLLNLTGNSANNIMEGNTAANIINGNAGADILVGHAGNDTLDGGVGADTLFGGADNDTYIIDNILDIFSEDANNDEGDTVKYGVNASTISTSTLTLGDANQNSIILSPIVSASLDLTNIENLTITGIGKYNLIGNAQNNALTGNAANNLIDGGDGNDTLNGGAGIDTLIGGLGDDTYVVDSLTEVNLINDTSGSNTLHIGLTYTLLDGGAFTNLTLTGTAAINGTGNVDANIITGNSAANILNGNGGADTLIGGDGGDTYVVDSADDVIKETNALAIGGIDLVKSLITFDLSDNSGENIRTTIENLTLEGTDNNNATGNALANTLTGNVGDNVLDGKEGVDILIGGAGSDTYEVDLKLTGIAGTATAIASLQDSITEANTVAGGIDTLNLHGDLELTKASTITLALGLENLDAFWTNTTLLNITGNAVDNDIYANDANNLINGGGGNDHIKGAAGNDIINGEAGDDWLIGGDGDDTLYGGAGLNTLEGGNGNDTYLIDFVVFKSGTDTYANAIVNIGVDPDGIDTVIFKGAIANTFYQDYFVAPSFENYDFSATGTTKINIGGSDVDNKLIGNAAANVIVGYLGNDTLDGGLGNDTLVGGDGDDTYFVNVAMDIVIELSGQGTDTIKSAVTYSLVDTDGVGVNGGNVENLELTGAAVINGTGNDLDNTITGNAAANILDGGTGADSMEGRDGADTYIVDNAGDTVTETNTVTATGGIDLVKSAISFDLSLKGLNVENLTLTGTAALGTGNALNNIITGNAGANTLDGQAGVDSLNGGLGDDTYIVDLIKPTPASTTVALQDSVTEALNAGTDNIILRGGTIATTATTLLTLGANIEGLDARGDNSSTGTGTTKLNITGNTLDNTIRGNDADNIIDGGIGNDFLRAYNGNDTLLGGAGADTLDGDDGNDILDGGVGVDQLQGDQGNDTYIVDIIASGTGVNTTAVLEDNIFGDAVGVDTLKLRGSITTTNASIINLGQIIQFVGDTNRYSIENADATLTGTTKLDFIGSNQENNIIGNAANNNMTGEAGNDTLNGAAGNDTLSGGIGNDSLDGGIGTDTMDGGEGDDIYVLDVIADSIINETGTSGTDTARTAFTANLSDAKFNNIENLVLTGAAVNGTGNALANDITGNDGANTLDGGLDSLVDTLRGGKGNDIYILRAGDTVIENLNEGTDLIRTALSFDLLLANNVENLTLLNVSNLGNIDPLNNINAFGNDLANTLTGNDGDNAFIGAAGADTLIGGKGNDRYNVNLKLTGIQGTVSAVVSLEDTIVESALVTDGLEDALSLVSTFNLTKASTITLAAGLEYLLAENTGTTLLNLTGNSANNIIQGNDAANIIDGDAGADTLLGFKGDDTYIVDIVNDALKFNLQDAIFEQFGTNGSSDGNDTLRLRGNLVIPAALSPLTYDLNFIGNGNLENIDASLTGTTRINLTGNAESNTLTGNAANNTLNGGTGDDTLIGGLGADTMIGGAGADTYYVDNINDVVDESGDINNNDAVFSSISYTIGATADIEGLTLTGVAAINGTGNDAVNFINGNSAANILIGGGNVDYLSGLAGADTLDGGTDADEMTGGDGNDTYIVDNTGDVVREFNANATIGGIDLVRVNIVNPVSGTYVLTNNVENAILINTIAYNLTGNALNNVLTGNAGSNELKGETGNDTLLGGDGVDTLTGGAGIDALTGGKGNDTYNIDLVRASALATSTVALQDTVSELANAAGSTVEGIDTIVLTNLTSNAGAPTDFSNITTVTTLTVNANVENFDASQTGTTKLNIMGNNLANTIKGNDADNILLDNAGGNDTLNGGTGADTLDGGLGVDALDGGTGNDTYLVDIIATTAGTPAAVTGAALQDTIDEINGTTDGIDTLKLRGTVAIPAATAATNIALIGALAGIENLDVSLTTTTRLDLTGNAENNILTGNAANNIIDGGLGNDILTGGAGNDIFVFDATGTSNFDVITDFVSGIDNIRLDGSRFDILFNPGYTADRLFIGSGGNVVAQSASHYLVYNKTTGELWFNRDANGTIDIDGNGIDAPELIAKFTPNTTLQWTDILNITLRGTSANDVLRGGRGNDNILEPYFGSDISGNDSAYGGDGDDFIQLGSGSDYIEGGAGNDLIYAGIELAQYSSSWPIQPDNDTVYGGDGNDSIYGGINGTDILDGGNGDDYLTGGSYATATLNIQNKLTLNGGAGNDTLIGGYGNDTLTGGAGNDLLIGVGDFPVSDGSDLLDGGDGDDTIRGGSGDTLLGGNGNDTLYGLGNGGAGDDTYHLNNYSLIVDTSGIDTVISYDSFTTLYTLGSAIENLIIRNANNITATGNSSNNIITTEASGNATLSGEGGNDKLTGYLGNDTINGGAGNDTITGSRGADILTGGLGADRFEYHAQEDSMFTSASDTITDFSQLQLDKIDFSIFDADATTVGINDAFTFIGNNVAFSNIAGQLRFDSANNTVYGDIDGNSTADIQITLTGVTNLMAGDFIL